MCALVFTGKIIWRIACPCICDIYHSHWRFIRFPYKYVYYTHITLHSCIRSGSVVKQNWISSYYGFYVLHFLDGDEKIKFIYLLFITFNLHMLLKKSFL